MNWGACLILPGRSLVVVTARRQMRSERNIRYFAHAIEVEGRLSSLEDKVGSLEGHLKRKGIMGGSQESEAI